MIEQPKLVTCTIPLPYSSSLRPPVFRFAKAIFVLYGSANIESLENTDMKGGYYGV